MENQELIIKQIEENLFNEEMKASGLTCRTLLYNKIEPDLDLEIIELESGRTEIFNFKIIEEKLVITVLYLFPKKLRCKKIYKILDKLNEASAYKYFFRSKYIAFEHCLRFSCDIESLLNNIRADIKEMHEEILNLYKELILIVEKRGLYINRKHIDLKEKIFDNSRDLVGEFMERISNFSIPNLSFSNTKKDEDSDGTKEIILRDNSESNETDDFKKISEEFDK